MARNQITTIDIGTNSVKALQVELTDAGLRIVNYGAESYPRQSATERVSDDLVMDTLSELMRKRLLRTKPVAMSIPRYSVTIKGLSGLPASATDENLDKMVPIQVGPELPFPIADSVYDSYNLQRSGDNISLEVVATKKSSIQRYTFIADKIGLKLKAIIPSSFATYAVIFERYKDELVGRNIAVADIGAGMTDIFVIEHGRLASSRSFSYGGNNLTQAFEREYGLEFSAAEEQKIGKASLRSDEDNAITKRWADSLSMQISQSLLAFAGEDRITKIDSLWLCGGSSQVPGLEEYLANKLDIKVSLWNPLQGIESEDIEETQQRRLSVALGIGIIGLDGAKRTPTVNANLLPKEIKEREQRARQKVKMVIASVLALLIVTGAVLSYSSWRSSKIAQYEQMTKRIKAIEQKEELKAARTSLENSILMQQVMTPYITPLEILREMSDKLPDRKRVALTTLNVDKKGRVSMGIEASSHADISEVIQVLNEMKFFDKTELFSEVKHGAITKTTKDKRPIFQVQILCTLNEKAASSDETTG